MTDWNRLLAEAKERISRGEPIRVKQNRTRFHDQPITCMVAASNDKMKSKSKNERWIYMKYRKKPVVIETPAGDTIGIRHMMILSLSYDHRVVDGGMGGLYIKRVAEYLENFDINTLI